MDKPKTELDQLSDDDHDDDHDNNNKVNTPVISDPSKKPRRLEWRRQKVIAELFASERSYQDQLELLGTYFEVPCKLSSLISMEDYKTIFGRLADIRTVNRQLLSAMQEEHIGAAFLKLGPFLKIYSEYVRHYETGLETLYNCEQNNRKFADFRRFQERRSELGGLQLNALLITPVQRVPRYKLLLEQLLRYTRTSHKDYSNIQTAVEQMEEIARHINAHAAAQSNFAQCLQAQNLFRAAGTFGASPVPRLVAPGRSFVRCGQLHRFAAHSGKPLLRYFFLFSDLLLYAKTAPLSWLKDQVRSKSPKAIQALAVVSPCSPTSRSRRQQVNSMVCRASALEAAGSQLHHIRPGSLECCCMYPLRHCKVERVAGVVLGAATADLPCQDGLFRVIFRPPCTAIGSESGPVEPCDELVISAPTSGLADDWVTDIDECIQRLKRGRSTLRKESSLFSSATTGVVTSSALSLDSNGGVGRAGHDEDAGRSQSGRWSGISSHSQQENVRPTSQLVRRRKLVNLMVRHSQTREQVHLSPKESNEMPVTMDRQVLDLRKSLRRKTPQFLHVASSPTEEPDENWTCSSPTSPSSSLGPSKAEPEVRCPTSLSGDSALPPSETSTFGGHADDDDDDDDGEGIDEDDFFLCRNSITDGSSLLDEIDMEMVGRRRTGFLNDSGCDSACDSVWNQANSTADTAGNRRKKDTNKPVKKRPPPKVDETLTGEDKNDVEEEEEEGKPEDDEDAEVSPAPVGSFAMALQNSNVFKTLRNRRKRKIVGREEKISPKLERSSTSEADRFVSSINITLRTGCNDEV